jgi:magnesium chelatase family protein
MAFAKTYSAQTKGLNAHIIDVEVDLSKGLNAFSIVGLPDKAVEEARDRIGSAIKNSGYTSPKSKNQKTIISLAPAHIKKEGALFDLPMALAYLLSSEDISFDTHGKIFFGELSLDGRLRGIKGALPLTIAAKNAGFKELYLPKENAEEAALIDGLDIFGVENLEMVIGHLSEKRGEETGEIHAIEAQEKTPIEYKNKNTRYIVDFADVSGQETAKRGMEIAAAGKHNIALYGPPGTGKTMLSKAFAGLLPIFSEREVIETTGIHSVAGALESELITEPPFRAPHHTSSYVSVVGGGSTPKPGEITLAHNGVLFMDEFPEFERRVVEALREPLEEGEVSISRAKGTERFPANFILIAAMNPCPCGNYGSEKECSCSPTRLMQYQRKMSGPIVDRIDMWIEVGQVEHKDLSSDSTGREKTGEIKKRVAKAREIQRKRFDGYEKITTNSEMGVQELKKLILLSEGVKNTLGSAAKQMELSARAYHRVIKLARTIADLEEVENIEEKHILEAVQYRPRQKQY